MGHCLSCILPRCMVRCKTKAGGIFSPLPPANRRHTARRAFRLYRNRRLRRRNRLQRFALRAVSLRSVKTRKGAKCGPAVDKGPGPMV